MSGDRRGTGEGLGPGEFVGGYSGCVDPNEILGWRRSWDGGGGGESEG